MFRRRVQNRVFMFPACFLPPFLQQSGSICSFEWVLVPSLIFAFLFLIFSCSNLLFALLFQIFPSSYLFLHSFSTFFKFLFLCSIFNPWSILLFLFLACCKCIPHSIPICIYLYIHVYTVYI